MNFLRQEAFESYRLTDIQTDRHDTTEIYTMPLRGWSINSAPNIFLIGLQDSFIDVRCLFSYTASDHLAGPTRCRLT